MTFNEIIEAMTANQKVVWSTKTEQFKLIERDNTDWKTPFSFTRKEAKRLGEYGVRNFNSYRIES